MSAFARLLSNTGLRHILSNSGWMMGEQVIRLVIGFLVSALVCGCWCGF
ncbi:MAG: hypothetical protein ACOY41_03915 [Pseudomonadota bacterium]